ncbi:Predicted N-acyltransferase, GNAT family [Franzmannia pantelleriensis]|uniref:Predicted N-acyltransferase, GNAT family n=1 Tax=Franzmannia pantelleriensis TaxID=48727 RepID=A0A1G9JSR7_9GAMM|nr:GNAT family N-acetyltransferase [Halomonas pantelleriensis]SDL40577.1 Predicted N-acyltransferase, GNAT family [Halomonas pantelleriensis]
MSDAISIEQGDWEELGSEAGEIRRIVFIVEQQVPQEEEWDGRDAFCLHFLIRHQGRALGTARLLPDGHLGRVAVLEEGRGLGLGRRLVEAAIEAARSQGHAHLELAAQLQAIPFYEQLGFSAYGDEFLDAGIPHRNMSLPLGD